MVNKNMKLKVGIDMVSCNTVCIVQEKGREYATHLQCPRAFAHELREKGREEGREREGGKEEGREREGDERSEYSLTA